MSNAAMFLQSEPPDESVQMTLTIRRAGQPDEVVKVPYCMAVLVYSMCARGDDYCVLENINRDDGN